MTHSGLIMPRLEQQQPMNQPSLSNNSNAKVSAACSHYLLLKSHCSLALPPHLLGPLSGVDGVSPWAGTCWPGSSGSSSDTKVPTNAFCLRHDSATFTVFSAFHFLPDLTSVPADDTLQSLDSLYCRASLVCVLQWIDQWGWWKVALGGYLYHTVQQPQTLKWLLCDWWDDSHHVKGYHCPWHGGLKANSCSCGKSLKSLENPPAPWDWCCDGKVFWGAVVHLTWLGVLCIPPWLTWPQCSRQGHKE